MKRQPQNVVTDTECELLKEIILFALITKPENELSEQYKGIVSKKLSLERLYDRITQMEVSTKSWRKWFVISEGTPS